MEKILRLFILILITIGMTRCKPQQNIVKTTSISDTLIRHTTEVLTLPINTTTIIKEPCKDSILQPINQTIKTGNTTATVTSENGSIKIDISTDSIKQSKSVEISKQKLNQNTIQTITKSVIPKWVWYVLAYSIIITLWLLRKPILKLINPLW